MCEFCTQHGEGKIWYLQMKNYAQELLSEELSVKEKQAIGFPNRLEWNNYFWKAFILPAMTGVPWKWEPRSGPAQTFEEQQIEHFGQVLPIEDVEKVIDMVDSITRLPCGCRFMNTGLSDRRYCFGFGTDKNRILGIFPEASSSLEVLDKQEAKKIFRKFDEEGLIHSIWTGVTPYVIGICNCDRDCGAYKGYIEFRGSPNFFRAEYVCQVDADQCTGCKLCMSQCQFGAQYYSSALGKVYINPSQCFGCGVCRAVCSNNAITMLPRQSVPEAAEIWLEGVTR